MSLGAFFSASPAADCAVVTLCVAASRSCICCFGCATRGLCGLLDIYSAALSNCLRKGVLCVAPEGGYSCMCEASCCRHTVRWRQTILSRVTVNFFYFFPSPLSPRCKVMCSAPPASVNSVALGATGSMWPLQFRPPCACAVLRFPSLIKHLFVRRAEDYWLGYKLFCFGYYSHSPQHVLEFRESKLGSIISPPPMSPCFSANCSFASMLLLGS
jgi:hypothetical protein